jgi:two-component system, chemotaxis family, sensor kinase CheA
VAATLKLPEELVARFRSVAQERLGKIEQHWSEVTSGLADSESSAELVRELHTLKGEARAVGFTDVNLVCHKLEELVGRAADQSFQVSDNFDLMVVSAIQFTSMLLRKRPGHSFGGIDLPGFVQQIDEILREQIYTENASETRIRSGRVRAVKVDEPERLNKGTSLSFAEAATQVFFEYLRSRGSARSRLHAIWRDLSRQIRRLEALALAPLLERHVKAALELAKDLGREVEFELDAGSLRVSADVAEVLEVFALHGLRNAVDHGIEPPNERRHAGKRGAARVRVGARQEGESVVVQIDDDGRGIDCEVVRARAVRAGLLSAERARIAREPELFKLLFVSGFSTSETPGDVSGRGVGLDAVHAAIQRAGGDVSITARKGAGSRFQARVPDSGWVIDVHAFRAPTGALLAVPADCRIAPAQGRAIDVLAILGIDAEVRGSGARERQLTVGFKRGGVTLDVAATTNPRTARAERLCPTPADFPAEVVEIDGEESLLVRPQEIYRIARERPY